MNKNIIARTLGLVRDNFDELKVGKTYRQHLEATIDLTHTVTDQLANMTYNPAQARVKTQRVLKDFTGFDYKNLFRSADKWESDEDFIAMLTKQRPLMNMYDFQEGEEKTLHIDHVAGVVLKNGTGLIVMKALFFTENVPPMTLTKTNRQRLNDKYGKHYIGKPVTLVVEETTYGDKLCHEVRIKADSEIEGQAKFEDIPAREEPLFEVETEPKQEKGIVETVRERIKAFYTEEAPRKWNLTGIVMHNVTQKVELLYKCSKCGAILRIDSTKERADDYNCLTCNSDDYTWFKGENPNEKK